MPTRRSLSTLRVLVVAGEAEAAGAITAHLLALGHDVRAVQSSADASALLADACFDLVFIDVELCESDVLRVLHGRLRGPRLIALTRDHVARAAAAALGFADVLRRPFDTLAIERALLSAPSPYP